MRERFAAAGLLLTLGSGCGPGHGIFQPGRDAGPPGELDAMLPEFLDAGSKPDSSQQLDAMLPEWPDAGGGRDAGVVLDAMPPDPLDAGPPRDGGPPLPCPNGAVDVDLVFLVDNSNSMREEQDRLRILAPRLALAIRSGDVDLDGTPDVPAVRSVHAGVINTDMGTGGFALCNTGERGDDGLLQTDGVLPPNSASCGPTPRVLAFDTPGEQTAFEANLSCLASQGLGGCGLEAHLEALLKAVSPDVATSWTAPGYVPPRFGFTEPTVRDWGPGHAGPSGANSGLVRPDSILVLVVFSDEEDCSVRNSDLYNNASAFGGVAPNLRCTSLAYQAQATYPVARYIEGFRALRNDPRKLVVASIVGVPTQFGGIAPNYLTILAHPDMQERESTATTNQLEYSCRAPGLSDAFPPRRIMQVQQGLAANGVATVVTSICSQSYDSFAENVATVVGTAAEELCGSL